MSQISTAQQRGYCVLKQLFGHEMIGIACHELAEQLDISKVTAYKDLKGLEAAGLAEQLPNKNWRLASSLAREAVKIMHGLDAARRRVEETAERCGIYL